jgi:EmrB/QacA subfamily drug resistance transporter
MTTAIAQTTTPAADVAASAAVAADAGAHLRRVLLVVSAAVFMASLDLFVVNIAFPDIQRDFAGSSLAGLSWVLNGYTIVFASLLVPVGRVADRFGRRRFFAGGLLLFVAASAACAAAPSVPLLVAARVVQAAGAAALMPTSLAILIAAFPPAKRAAAIGIWAAVGGVAAAAGPPLGGLLVEASWRWVFLINVPFGLAAAYYASRVLDESRDGEQTRWPDALGTAALTGALALLSLGLVKAPDWGWGDARTVASLAAAVAGLGLFARRSARHPVPVIELSMLRVRSFATATTAALLFSIAFGAMLLAGVLFLTGVWHYSILHAGIAFAPGPATAALFAVPAGRLAGRIGQRTLVAAGSGVFALGCLWWALEAGSTPDYARELLPGMLITGVGVGLTLPSVSSAAVASLPPARLATGSGVLAMSRQLGFVLGVAIFVAIFDSAAPADALSHFHAGWAFMAISAGLGAVAGAAIGRIEAPAATP